MAGLELWSVYLARCSDDSLYTGVAKDVRARLKAHNEGKGAAYTRSRRPIRLVYHKPGLTRSEALMEEARIKSLDRPEKLALLKAARRLRRTALKAAAALLVLAGSAGAAPTFNKETTVSIASAAPQSITYTAAATYTYPIRMYYIPAVSSAAPHLSSAPWVYSAASVDGLAWVADNGARISSAVHTAVSFSSVTGCSVTPLSGGGFRMLYSIVSTTGAFRIHSTTSADGLNWGNHGTVVVDGGTTFVGSPRVVVLDSGDWRLYYTRDFDGSDQLADRRLFTARSTDEGANWGASSLLLSTAAYETAAAKLTDGRVRLFYTQPVQSASSATVVLSAVSTDALGTTFNQETGIRLSTSSVSGGISFPAVIRSTDSWQWRLYYSFFAVDKTTGDAQSALTGAPDVQSISPSVVYRSAAANLIAISGEGFSPAPANVQVRSGATIIAGAGVTRASDMSVSATFATQNQALGFYDIRVTNADGAFGTLTNGLLIDFAPGSVQVVGNLLRPRDGTPMTADITTFNAGRVTARVHDADGRVVRVVMDAEQQEGSVTVTWDGRDASGASVKSGVYLMHVTGPKLNHRAKIVLIR